MENKTDYILDIVDIEKKFGAAKRLMKHMGLADKDAIFKANKIIIDLTGIDYMDVFDIEKQKIMAKEEACAERIEELKRLHGDDICDIHKPYVTPKRYDSSVASI